MFQGRKKTTTPWWYPQQKSQKHPEALCEAHFAIQWSIPKESMLGIFTYVCGICRQTCQSHGSYGTSGWIFMCRKRQIEGDSNY